jgi:hypothetical protein
MFSWLIKRLKNMKTFRVVYEDASVIYVEAKTMREAISIATCNKSRRAVSIEEVEKELV